MGEHIYRALDSVLAQLTSDFEVVVIDDGSEDNSLSELARLKQKYSSLSFYAFTRESGRKLGATRNLAIEKARGEYVVLHIDADDLWDKGIVEWCRQAELLSKRYSDNIYISGKQINFVSKTFITEFGGYRNMYYTEDRDLWGRLAAQSKIIYVDHAIFRKRMEIQSSVRFRKVLVVSWYMLLNDLRARKTVYEGLVEVLSDLRHSFKNRGFYGAVLRCGYLPLAFITAIVVGILPDHRVTLSKKNYAEYKKNNTRTFSDWLSV
jgi:glycosyltransferase involved in cell wall biosynthesis